MDNLSAEEKRQIKEVATRLSQEAQSQGKTAEAQRWQEVAASFDEPGARLENAGDIQPAPVQPAPIEPIQPQPQPAASEPGYYYFDAGSNQWVPTTRVDVEQRKQAGQKTIEPRQ